MLPSRALIYLISPNYRARFRANFVYYAKELVMSPDEATPIPSPESSKPANQDLAGARISDVAGGQQVQASRPGPVIVVEPLTHAELGSRKKSMLEMLRKMEGGEKYVAEAQKLADATTLDNLGTLLEYGKEAREALSSIANEMTGDARIGSAGPVGKLFSELTELEKELKIDEISAPKSFMVNLLTALPFGLGKQFEPIYQFVERYKKIKPEIDEKEQHLKELEVARTTSKEQLKELQQTLIDGFRGMEIAIAAGEIVLDRELGKFEVKRKELLGSDDIVRLQELKAERLSITNLDNRVMRMQNARMDEVMDFPIIDLAIDNEEKLRSNLEDLREITIPQIRKAVAIAVRIHDQREAAALAGGIQELNQAIREANLTALGMAQQETHKVATQASREVEHLVKSMDKLSALLVNGNELIKENERLNAEAREKLLGAEAKFKKDVEASLQDLAKS